MIFHVLPNCRWILGALLAVAPLDAGPIQYSINFTATLGTAPTNGSFFYDASAPVGSQFSSFTVTWDGIQFDLTRPANLPSFASDGGTCDDNVFAFLETGSACANHHVGLPVWGGDNFTRNPDADFYFVDQDAANTGLLEITAYTPSMATQPNESDEGVFTITPLTSTVPEPSSLMLVLAGGGWLLLKRSFPAARRNSPPGPTFTHYPNPFTTHRLHGRTYCPTLEATSSMQN